MSTVLATGATKKEYVSELASENASQIELKGIIKLVFKDFASKRQTLQKHQFLLSQTHIWHLLGSTISSKNPLRNAARNAFEKRLTKERNKSLAGSTVGGNGLKMCPKRIQIEFPSRFIFHIFSNFSL